MPALGQSDVFANHKAGTWQLISVNVNRETSADVEEIVKRSLKLECAHSPACNFCVAGNQIVGHAESEAAWICLLWKPIWGSPPWWFQIVSFQNERSWGNRGEMYSSSLRVFFFCHGRVCATPATKTWMYMRQSLRMSPKSCGKDVAQKPRKFYIAGDLNVELRLLCTDDEDVEELQEMYGPLRWHGCNNDQGGFKKLMWYEITEEFHWKKDVYLVGL